MKLSDVIKTPNAAERRSQLRKMAAPIFEKSATAKGLADIFAGSPLIGDASNQIKVRATPSGLRDSLSENVLLGILTDTICVSDILDAIFQPSVHGREDRGTSTGYLFGHPGKLTDTVITNMRAAVFDGSHDSSTHVTRTVSTAAKAIGEAMPNHAMIEAVKTCDLGHLINTFDIITAKSGATAGQVLSAMTESLNDEQAKARIAAISAAISARGATSATVIDPHIPTLVSTALGQLEKAGVMAKPKAATTTSGLTPVDPSQTAVIDAVLAAVKLPPVNELIERLNKSEIQLKEVIAERDDLKAKPSTSVTLMPVGTTIRAAASGKMPSGTVVTKPAYEVFGLKKGQSFDFEVPVWEWDGPHPYVPVLDKDYIFRPKELMAALYSLITGERSWSSGHTGTGKTTLWEQIGARLNWPVRVLSFDSEITRADLIGQHVLVNDGGVTISKFVEGILPQCMGQPIIIVCDELDYIRPDVAYVMQRVLEMKGLTLTEDGGRIVQPHPMFRLVATANTEGQGDDYGMYAGARVQSAAFLDRFTSWIRVDYLTAEQRLSLLKAKVDGLDDPTAEQVNKYTTEHIEAFKNAKVMKPISPRGMIALGQKVANYLAIFPSKSRKDAIAQALESCILNACTQQDRVVLKGIADRIFV